MFILWIIFSVIFSILRNVCVVGVFHFFNRLPVDKCNTANRAKHGTTLISGIPNCEIDKFMFVPDHDLAFDIAKCESHVAGFGEMIFIEY